MGGLIYLKPSQKIFYLYLKSVVLFLLTGFASERIGFWGVDRQFQRVLSNWRMPKHETNNKGLDL